MTTTLSKPLIKQPQTKKDSADAWNTNQGQDKDKDKKMKN